MRANSGGRKKTWKRPWAAEEMKRSLRKLAVTVNMDMLEAVRFVFSAKEQRWRWKWVSSEVGDSQMHSRYFLATRQTTLSCALIRTFTSESNVMCSFLEVVWYFSYVELLNYFETVACVASVSVGLGSKGSQRNGIFVFCPREKWCSLHFLRGKNTTNPFLRLSLLPNPTETLATQAIETQNIWF